MKAYLVLKHAGGDTADELPTAATIKGRLASEETVQKAEKAARQLGFTVVSATPIQVTIEGPKEQFEKAFSSKLKSADKRVADQKAGQKEIARGGNGRWLRPLDVDDIASGPRGTGGRRQGDRSAPVERPPLMAGFAITTCAVHFYRDRVHDPERFPTSSTQSADRPLHFIRLDQQVIGVEGREY